MSEILLELYVHLTVYTASIFTPKGGPAWSPFAGGPASQEWVSPSPPLPTRLHYPHAFFEGEGPPEGSTSEDAMTVPVMPVSPDAVNITRNITGDPPRRAA